MNKLEHEIPGNTPQKADAFHKNKKKELKPCILHQDFKCGALIS